MHNFGNSVRRGHVWEAWAAEHMAEIMPPGLELQCRRVESGGRSDLKGVDLHIYAAVQIKGDEKSYDTKNVFVETESVHEAGVAGCIETSKADWFVYLLPGFGLVYWSRAAKLKAILLRWKAEFNPVPSWNEREDGTTYQTKGLLVPMGRFSEVVEHTVSSLALYEKSHAVRRAA